MCCIVLIVLINVRLPIPLWKALFPRPGILGCLSVERRPSTSKHACVNFFLLTDVDVSSCFKFLP